VHHPGLLRVVWSGTDSKGPVLVTEYVHGQTLRENLEESGRLPEPLVRAVAAQVGGALAALHAAGYSHGDVKPENVRMDSTGHAVLLDLGFAQRGAAKDALHSGSLAYLAPERTRGRGPSGPSDVFALGLMLFELATSQHPFPARGARQGGTDSSWGRADASGDSSWFPLGTDSQAQAQLEALAEARFVPPSRHVPQLSPFLDELSREMLARQPAARPSAADVARRFAEQEAGDWWRERIDFGAGARRSPSELGVRHLTPLVGRDRELSALLERYDRAVASVGGVRDHALWLDGPAGIGKSRLVSDFAAQARERTEPPIYLYGRCPRLDVARPCTPVLRLLHRYLMLPPGASPGERERAQLLELLDPQQAQTLLLALDPEREEARADIPAAAADWLAALGRRHRSIICLDDINHADEGTLNALARLAVKLPETRLLLVLVRREHEAVRHPRRLAALAERLDGFPGDPASTIPLGPLRSGDVEELVRLMFHPTVPRRRLAGALESRSHGNPGFLAETLRGLLARGQAHSHSDDDPRLELDVAPEDLRFPASLHTLVAERYRALPEEDRRWLHRLAVIGGRIEPEFVMRVFHPATRTEVDAMLGRLVRAEWLVAVAARYRFARPALREAVYLSIPAGRRRRLHTAAARGLEQRPDGRASLTRDYQRAFHLRSAEQHEELLACILPLVDRFVHRGLAQRVYRLAVWGIEALDALPGGHERDRLRIRFLEAAGDAADRLGTRAEQRAWLDRLSDLELDPERDRADLTRVYLLHGRYAVSTGQYGMARGLLRNAVELSKAGGELDELNSEALRRLAAVQAHIGELIDARRLARLALERAVHDPQRAVSWLQLGVVEVLEDRLENGLRAVDEALRLLRHQKRWSLPGAFAAAHLVRGRIYRLAGRPRRALASLTRALRLARRAGERRLENEILARLGGLLIESNRGDEAETLLREALLTTREIEDRRGQALAGLWLGILLLERGESEAGALLSRTEVLAREVGLQRVEGLAAAVRARWALTRSSLSEASRRSARAMELLERHGAELGDRIVITATQALILDRLERGEEARELVTTLRRRLRRENRRLQNAVLRSRHRQATTRLLETVLSEPEAVYPRVELAWGRGPLIPP